MQKAIVIGCPGSGKSTFSRKLSTITSLPLYHLDLIWHKPDKTTISQSDFDQRLSEIIAQDSWIIDGNFQRTLETRIEASDTIFLLDFPLDVCLAGARLRIGIKRPDMPWVEEMLDPEFERMILEFREAKLPQIYNMLDKYGNGKTVHIFKSRKEADVFIEKAGGVVNDS